MPRFPIRRVVEHDDAVMMMSEWLRSLIVDIHPFMVHDVQYWTVV